MLLRRTYSNVNEQANENDDETINDSNADSAPDGNDEPEAQSTTKDHRSHTKFNSVCMLLAQIIIKTICEFECLILNALMIMEI